jgi:hypothetical protein
MIHALSRPARLISVLLALSFLLLWFAYLRDLGPVCSFPGGARLPLIGTAAAAAEQGSQAATRPAALDADAGQRPLARIGKVTVATNKLNSPLIDRALQSHAVHNEAHGYPHFIAENQAVGTMIENDAKKRPQGAWTKPAYIMSIIVAELQRPEEERMQWLL